MGVWIGCLDLLHLLQFVITSNRALPLISAPYSSLLQTLVSSVYYSLHYPFPGNGYKTRNYKVSLNYTLQISWYYGAYEVFSSHAKSSPHRLTFNSVKPHSLILMPQSNSSAPHAHILADWPLETQPTSCHFFSIIFDCHLREYLNSFSQLPVILVTTSS
jgi:hypothetical protein